MKELMLNPSKFCKDQNDHHSICSYLDLSAVHFCFPMSMIQIWLASSTKNNQKIKKLIKTKLSISYIWNLAHPRFSRQLKNCILLISSLLVFSCSNNKDPSSPLQLLDGWTTVFLYSLSVPGLRNEKEKSVNDLLGLLNLTQKKAYCAFHDLDQLNIIQKLIALKQNNMDVRIAIDEDNRNGIGFLELNKVFDSTSRNRNLILGNKGTGELYLSFCIIDDNRAYFNTSGFTEYQLSQNSFVYGYVQSSPDGLINKFSSMADLFVNGSFGSSKQKLNQRNQWLVNDVSMGLYFSPEEKPLDFIINRVKNAKGSIQLYTSQFYSNSRDSETLERKTGDLGFELYANQAISKSILVTSGAETSPDTDAKSSCQFNTYLGIECDSTKSAGVTSNSPRRENSIYYLKKNNLNYNTIGGQSIDNGLNFILVDSELNSRQAFISSFPFSSRSNSSHDGFMLNFYDPKNVSFFKELFDSMILKSSLDTSKPSISNQILDVVISEMLWMGSTKNDGTRNPAEWIEFYNTTDSTINLSGWKFQCGISNSFSTIFQFPSRTLIGPKQYFVVKNKNDSSVKYFHLALEFGDDAIQDSREDQCRILDTTSKIIDISGTLGVPFLDVPQYYGVIDVDRKLVRSMERINYNISGENLSNWKTNSNSNYTENKNITPDYLKRTFGTPGLNNSSTPFTYAMGNLDIRKLVINEISSKSNQTFVELYNPSDGALNLDSVKIYLARGSNCSISNGNWTSTSQLSGIIPAKGYYLISRPGHSYESIAQNNTLGSISSSYCLGLILDEATSSLTHPGMVDFVNLGNNNTSILNSTFLSGSTIQRCTNGNRTGFGNNSTDFKVTVNPTPGVENQCP